MRHLDLGPWVRRNAAELFIAFLVLATSLSVSLNSHWEHLDVFLLNDGDARGYYQYLPGLFIEGDLKDLYWAHVLENGNRLNLFQIGVAILQCPFFLLGHLFAIMLGFPVTGYSTPYCVSIFASAAVYCAISMFVLTKMVGSKFGKRYGILTALLVFFATNLFFYTAYRPGMSHVYSFFLISCIVFLTEKYWEERRPIQLFGMIILIGLVVSIRSYNGIIVFYFLFAGEQNKGLGNRMQMMISQWKHMLFAVIVVLIIFGLQVAYWHLITGDYLTFTYATKGEHFNWSNPQLWNVLFSHQNGWFMYHPLMLIAMVSVFWNAIRDQLNGRVILLLFCISWYLISSWWNWWFGGAYGHRAFLDMVPLYVIPLAFILKALLENRRAWVKLSTGLMLVVLAYASIYQSRLYELDHRPWDGENWKWSDYVWVWQETLPW